MPRYRQRGVTTPALGHAQVSRSIPYGAGVSWADDRTSLRLLAARCWYRAPSQPSSPWVCELGIAQVAAGRRISPLLSVAENLALGGALAHHPNVRESFLRCHLSTPLRTHRKRPALSTSEQHELVWPGKGVPGTVPTGLSVPLLPDPRNAAAKALAWDLL